MVGGVRGFQGHGLPIDNGGRATVDDDSGRVCPLAERWFHRLCRWDWLLRSLALASRHQVGVVYVCIVASRVWGRGFRAGLCYGPGVTSV